MQMLKYFVVDAICRSPVIYLLRSVRETSMNNIYCLLLQSYLFLYLFHWCVFFFFFKLLENRYAAWTDCHLDQSKYFNDKMFENPENLKKLF